MWPMDPAPLLFWLLEMLLVATGLALLPMIILGAAFLLWQLVRRQ